MDAIRTDIAIIGGGLGACAAALAAARMGRRVVLTEETRWLGGQLTNQAVPPDEHPWIEGSGCTASYRRLRDGIRDYYRRNYPLLPDARFDAHLNPGLGRVSRLCHEPRVALSVLNEMIAPYFVDRQLEILLCVRPLAVDTEGNRARAVLLHDDVTGEQLLVHAPYVLDATELGDAVHPGDDPDGRRRGDVDGAEVARNPGGLVAAALLTIRDLQPGFRGGVAGVEHPHLRDAGERVERQHLQAWRRAHATSSAGRMRSRCVGDSTS